MLNQLIFNEVISDIWLIRSHLFIAITDSELESMKNMMKIWSGNQEIFGTVIQHEIRFLEINTRKMPIFS